jgi:glycosyltransferase involved in cell wall biosynthesis
MKWRFLFSGKITKGYDRVILSGEASTAVHLTEKNVKTFYYAHNLPHELFDGRKEYMKRVPFFYHEFYMIALFVRKYLFLYEMRKIGKIMTNSLHNKKFLEEWTGRQDIEILYPPVNMLRFRPVRQKSPFIIQEHNNVESVIKREIPDYYISIARLTEKKRVGDIIHAFRHMPDKNLIVLYNPDDPDKEHVMKEAVGCNNIFFYHEPHDMNMAKIIASSVASITLAKEANF